MQKARLEIVRDVTPPAHEILDAGLCAVAVHQARHSPNVSVEDWMCSASAGASSGCHKRAAPLHRPSAFYMIHPHRSKEAFAALIHDWAGILVSDGYGVYQTWVERRQTCLAHLIRTARSLAERQPRS